MISGNQRLGKCNQPRPSASADYTCLDLDYSGYHKNLIQLLFIITIITIGISGHLSKHSYMVLCNIKLSIYKKTVSRSDLDLVFRP